MPSLSRLLNKSASYALLLHLSWTPLLASSLEDEVVKQAKPDRTTSLIFVDHNRKYFAYKEYYLGAEGNNCLFNALETTREEAINAVKGALSRGSLTTAQLLDKAIEDQLHEPVFSDLLALSPEERRLPYLDIYRTSPLMIECPQKLGQTQRDQVGMVTLFNVFTYVLRRNVTVFTPRPDFPQRLSIFHRVMYEDCQHPTLYLLLKGSHFNQLIDTRKEGFLHDLAMMEEQHYLEALRMRVRQESAPIPEDITFSSSQCNLLDELSEPTLEENQTSVSDDTQSDLEHIPSTSAHISSPCHAPCSRSEAIDFILNKSTCIPGKSHEDSCKTVWDTRTLFHSSYEYFAAKATLLLDHDFTPQGQERAKVMTDLITNKPTSFLTKAEKQQVNIFLGRLYMTQGNMDTAWNHFKITLENRSYSQAARLYMAQMILEHNYRPLGIRNPNAYALELLDTVDQGAAPRRTRTRQATHHTSRGTYLHNPYLNQSESHHFVRNLTRLAQQSQRSTERAQGQGAPTKRARPVSTATILCPTDVISIDMGIHQTGVYGERNTSKRQRSQGQDDVLVTTPTTTSSISDDAPSLEGLPQESDFFSSVCPSSADILSSTSSSTSDTQDDIFTSSLQESPLSNLTQRHALLTFEQGFATLLQAKAHALNRDFERSLALYDQLIESLEDSRTVRMGEVLRKKLLGRALNQLANTLHKGKINTTPETEHNLFQRALGYGRQIQNLDIQLTALMGLGNCGKGTLIDGRYFTRQALYEEAFQIATVQNDTFNKVRALIGMANASHPRDALALYQNAITLCGNEYPDMRQRAESGLRGSLRYAQNMSSMGRR